MMGKIVIGKSFGGCVRYVVKKLDAEILFAEGIRMENPSEIALDFDTQRKINPGLSKAVGHISLNWSARDEAKLDSSKMMEIAMEYLNLMGIKNTQLLIARHNDSNHPHLHIIYNRVDNSGRTISDQFQLKKNVAACKSITLKHGFYMAPDKKDVNRKALKGADVIKYQLFDIIKLARENSKDWKLFEKQLAKYRIEIIPKYKKGSNEIQGISFRKDELIFKASSLDRSLSFGQLDSYFKKQNAGKENQNPGTLSQNTDIQYSCGNGIPKKGTNISKIISGLIVPALFPIQPNPIQDSESSRINDDEEQSKRNGRAR